MTADELLDDRHLRRAVLLAQMSARRAIRRLIRTRRTR